MRRLILSDASAAGRCLARAFANDPLMDHLLPNANRRDRMLRRLCTLVVQHGIRYGQVDGVGDAIHGVAVWLPPAEAQASLPRLLYTGGWRLPFLIGINGTRRMLSFRGVIERRYHRLVPQPHWLLHMLGVDPEHQGRGLASKLLTDRLQRLDQTQVDCVLETVNPRSAALYERFGFRTLEEILVPDSDLRCKLMLRRADSSR